MAAKSKKGRPKLAKADGRSKVVTLRLRADERKAIEKAAKAVGKPLSAWIREVLAEASRSDVD